MRRVPSGAVSWRDGVWRRLGGLGRLPWVGRGLMPMVCVFKLM